MKLKKIYKFIPFKIKSILYHTSLKLAKRFTTICGYISQYLPYIGCWHFYQVINFWRLLGYWPNFHNPRSLCEKIHWLKLYWRDPIANILVDKLAIRYYVQYLVPDIKMMKILFITSNAETIPFDMLPDKCVIKSNFGSGHVIFFNRNESDINEIKFKCREWLKKPYGTDTGEWAYLHVPRYIFGEEILLDDEGKIPNDYKFYVFNGKVELISVISDRFGKRKHTYFDVDWNILNVKHKNYPIDPSIAPPMCLNTMINVSETLATGFKLPFARIDLFEVRGKVYFGEITLYPGGGILLFEPRDYDFVLGSKLDISELMNKRKNI